VSATQAHEHLTSERTELGRRAQLLAGASVTYNVVEAVIAVTAGIAAGSVALVGFGLDSMVEVSSGLIILWQFRHRLPESRERQALRLMAFSFFGLAAYVTYESVRALFFGGQPEPSPVGIGLAVASLIVMPFLSWAQRRTGRALSSHAVVADSTQTLLCTYLSAVLLVGLVLNATVGWGWADPLAGLVIAGVAVEEGIEAWRGDGCCAPARGGGNGHDDDVATEAGSTCGDGCCSPAVPGLTVVREGGLEPPRPKAPDPKSGVAAVTPLPRGPGV
jgi:divalent metal cation (Fe/Co/Zn/Cd) transporter